MKETTSLEHARTSYNVRHWRQGFFGINDQGHVYVALKADEPHQSEVTAITAATIAHELFHLWNFKHNYT